ncbi:hypothetical protein BpHYR1_051993 [Brachionus plicatilis]|uniref:Uncharacterized protein n=1 Tax=Brachionus plicatilis TaxID=10195 RepID=A0A3M7R3Q4_BRAPC|nr:hypothetical protein BpHYR1_051993 [Brachionus plicatilis]
MCLEHYYAINKLETVIENKKNEADQLINLSIEINQEHKDCDCNATSLNYPKPNPNPNLLLIRF